MDWWNLMKQSVTVGAQLLRGGRYGCNYGRYDCTIVMSYIEINKAVSQWLLTFNLCVSVTWPLTCAFHIPCTHTPEIIDMHRGMCDNWTTSYKLGQYHDWWCQAIEGHHTDHVTQTASYIFWGWIAANFEESHKLQKKQSACQELTLLAL